MTTPYTAAEWRDVLLLLVSHGLLIEAEDRETGTITVRVP